MRTTRSLLRSLLTTAALLVSGAGLYSCTPDYADQKALSRLIFNQILDADGGAFLAADGVVSETFNLVGDDATFGISNEAVSPNANLAIYDVLLDGYTVSFERTDGGSAVPAAFGTNFTQRIPITGFGDDPQVVGVEIRVLQPEQKLLTPLSDLTFFGFEQSTGFSKIQTRATIHMFGRNLTGDRVDLEFPIRVSFCNSCRADAK